MTRKWIEVNDLSGGQYSVTENVRFKNLMLRSKLCDYSDAYIAVNGTIDLSVAAANKNDKAEKKVQIKNNAPFRLCISKNKNTLIDNAEGLDIVIPMYILLE